VVSKQLNLFSINFKFFFLVVLQKKPELLKQLLCDLLYLLKGLIITFLFSTASRQENSNTLHHNGQARNQTSQN